MSHSDKKPLTAEGERNLRAIPRVLMVDDSAETREVYKRFLARSGHNYDIAEAETVEEGLSLLATQSFDCVVLDYCLPDDNGIELLKEISGDNGRCDVPVVMITGMGDESVAVEAMKRGAKDYLVKDRINAGSLVGAIEYALQKARTEKNEERYRESLEEQTITDPLTGIYNRRYLFDRLDTELSRAIRYKSPLCLLVLDLDHFKQVNDNWGHLVGDKVIVGFAGLLKKLARTTDIIARYGGEEFCVVVTGTDLDGAEQLAERICAEARQLKYSNGKGEQFAVSCSVGIAEVGPSWASVEQLVEQADQALYLAKNSGRDQVRTAEQKQCISA